MILNQEMVLMNKLWGQTQRFEKHNKDLMEENEQLKQRNEFLKKRCNEYWEEAGLNSDYFK